MTDTISEKHRSWNMSRIRSTDTLPEYAVRSVLHRLGFRFRINCKGMPGKPDILLPMYRTVVFIHGCYWHRHPKCERCTTPKTRRTFWLRKFASNVERDRRDQEDLRKIGWSVVVVWECEILKNPIEATLGIIEKLPGCSVEIQDVNQLPPPKTILKASRKRRSSNLSRTKQAAP